ncbi:MULTISPECIES: hypothetical protein [unclassified Gemella]|uniref:hypothetical protein n=1 Tax=unclassified Gemella TaxID=2624949 RepID=UPI00207B63DA|nr:MULTISPECIES: hypothetical protein [unclassified Gemella]
MTSQFFQTLYPKIPFTYAVSLMREAVGGVYYPSATGDILYLLFYFVIFLLAGLGVNIFKDLVNKPSKNKEKYPLFL